MNGFSATCRCFLQHCDWLSLKGKRVAENRCKGSYANDGWWELWLGRPKCEGDYRQRWVRACVGPDAEGQRCRDSGLWRDGAPL